MRKYEKHPSIQMIKQNFRISKKFSFEPVSKDEVKKIIRFKEQQICGSRNSNKNLLKMGVYFRNFDAVYK